MTQEDMPQPQIKREIYDLFDEYVHSSMSRQDFVKRLIVYAPLGMSAAALADFLLPKYAQATQVAPTDARVQSGFLEYTSAKGAGRMKALLARPAKSKEKRPGVIVVHENRGLNPYIEDVARRLALADFIALAPDALTPLGGYPGNDDEGKVLQSKRKSEEMLADFIAAFDYLKTQPECTGKVGVVGFCFGGGIANQMAVRLPDLAAAVPFYGSQAPAEDVSRIHAPLLLHFAEKDERITAGWPAYEAALKEHHKAYTAFIYPGVMHGFHNDTTPRYDAAAATLAWERTLAFFKEKLD
ncbi:MAG: dienelactone hydrolase family protein [Candidatus Sericytochromatia bacterium]